MENNKGNYSEIMAEVKRAEAKWPEWPTNRYEALAILTEEIGELAQACLKEKHEGGNTKAIKTEAVQVAAMAIRFIRNLDSTALFEKVPDVEINMRIAGLASLGAYLIKTGEIAILTEGENL